MAIAFVNAGSAEATTVTIPAGHAAGHLLIIFAFRDGSTTAPTVPAGWSSLGANAGTSCASALAYKVAKDSDTSGTWTNATDLVCHVYSGQATNKVPVVAPSAQTGTGTTVNYSGLAPMQCPGSSWVAAFAGHSSIDTSIETPPTSMVNRTDSPHATAEAVGHDSNGVLNTYTFNGVAVGGTSGNWISKTVEILAEHSNINNYQRFRTASDAIVAEHIR